MKKIFIFIILGWAGFSSAISFAEGYAKITEARWSKDETQFVLGYKNGFDTGSDYYVDVYDVASGKQTKSYEKFLENAGKNAKNPLAQKMKALQSSLSLQPTGWLIPDPLTYAHQGFPCCWPPKTGARYESQPFIIDGKKCSIILKTSAPKEEKNRVHETAYSLFFKSEKEEKLIASWERPKNDGEEKGYNFTLGAIGTSPSKKWIVVLLRRFDQGFESSNAIPIPYFFPKKGL